MKKILIFTQFYLPGYKAGGPIVSISNLVEELKNDFELFIITTDRDAFENKKYENITQNQWIQNKYTNLYYAEDKELTVSKIRQLIRNVQPDSIYLNSFFSLKFSIFPLLALKFFAINSPNIIIAPRGEFSTGALKIKKFKKSFFIFVFKFFNLNNKMYWHATSKEEKSDIEQLFLKKETNIFISSNLVKKSNFIKTDTEKPITGNLKMIYLSRITPKKNLLFAINVLKKINRNVDFDIFGLIDNEKYWGKCKNEIERLPKNISASYKNILKHDEVIKTFKKYDILFLPTKGENFGHVILESLFAGTLALISDKTPWNDIEKNRAGWAVSLKNKEKFINIIENKIDIKAENRKEMRLSANRYYDKIVDNKRAVKTIKSYFNL